MLYWPLSLHALVDTIFSPYRAKKALENRGAHDYDRICCLEDTAREYTQTVNDAEQKYAEVC